jgi:hypothetical protein
MTENDRPQDVGRAHKRRGAPAPETEELLERYRSAMRRELAGLLDELEPAEVLTQQSIDGTADKPVGLGLVARRERWELAIKLARELAGAIEPPMTGPAPSSTRSSPSSRRSSAPRLTARERRALA